ncbi:MAG: hypothetical protein EBZ51_11080, partial [Synechococcaceae bacterium WB9_2_112]|nr:hypothetical protein [Synechococcaceae bacterium WB9_2_112]
NFGGTIALTNSSYTGSNAVSLTRSTGYARLRYSNSLTLTSGVSYLASAMVRDRFAATGDEFEFWNDNVNGPVLVSVRYPPLLTNNLAGGTNWVKVRQLFTCTNSGNGAIMLVAWNPPSNNTYVIDNFFFRPCTTNGLSYQWQRDGVAISNATSGTLSLTNLQTNQAGSYRVVVSSSFGSVTSEVATLTLGTPPVFTSTNSFSGTVGVAFSNTVTASGSTPITFGGTSLPSGLSVATNGLITGTPTNAGTFSSTLTASNFVGSTNQSVTFVIARGTPAISNWPTASPITYGQAVSNSVLSGGVANPTGNFTWTVPTNKPNAGTNSQSVTFTPTATNNYNSVSTNISLVVNKATPVLTWTPSPAAGLTYPAPLSSTQLNATSTVAGIWSYNPTNGSVLNAGTNTLVGTFTPTDATNYTSGGTITNTVVVAKGSNTITFGALPVQYLGDAAFNLTATASSGLTVTYTSSNTNVATVSGSTVTLRGVGTTTITASQAGNSNWNAATSVTQTLTVEPALNRGLIAYLPFIGNANDVTGAGYNGNLQGVTLTADRFGATNQAYYFAGNNEHITLARNLPDTQELTFVGWMRADEQRYGVIFYDAAYFTPGRDTEIAINTGGRLQATFTKPDLGDSITTGEVWQTGQWAQVALVLRSGGARVFLNGQVVGSSAVAGNNMGYHSAPFLGAANHGLRVEYGFKGAMDEIRFYSRGLSDSEISQLYQSESAGLAPAITSTSSFSGTVGVVFSNTATASGSAPITFGGSNLPAGLSIATNGVISGTPTTAG